MYWYINGITYFLITLLNTCRRQFCPHIAVFPRPRSPAAGPCISGVEFPPDRRSPAAAALTKRSAAWETRRFALVAAAGPWGAAANRFRKGSPGRGSWSRYKAFGTRNNLSTLVFKEKRRLQSTPVSPAKKGAGHREKLIVVFEMCSQACIRNSAKGAQYTSYDRRRQQDLFLVLRDFFVLIMFLNKSIKPNIVNWKATENRKLPHYKLHWRFFLEEYV